MIGAHGTDREANDYYATDPAAVEALLSVEPFNHFIWEPACGEMHISNKLMEHGYKVISSDIIKRGNHTIYDFLDECNTFYQGSIITNPPYRYATEFVKKALQIVTKDNKVAMLLKLQFLEGKERRKLFDEHPPKTVYVFSNRVKCGKNGIFTNVRPAMAFAWFVWQKGWRGSTTIKWI